VETDGMRPRWVAVGWSGLSTYLPSCIHAHEEDALQRDERMKVLSIIGIKIRKRVVGYEKRVVVYEKRMGGKGMLGWTSAGYLHCHGWTLLALAGICLYNSFSLF